MNYLNKVLALCQAYSRCLINGSHEYTTWTDKRAYDGQRWEWYRNADSHRTMTLAGPGAQCRGNSVEMTSAKSRPWPSPLSPPWQHGSKSHKEDLGLWLGLWEGLSCSPEGWLRAHSSLLPASHGKPAWRPGPAGGQEVVDPRCWATWSSGGSFSLTMIRA